MHRNSQKRIYIPGRPYFITTVTKNRVPFFENDFLCELFVLHLEYCRHRFGLEILGYKINPEHNHLLFSVGGSFTISDVMRSLKTNFSREANRMLGFSYDSGDVESDVESRRRRFETSPSMKSRIRDFIKSEKICNHNFPKFHWQKSFHDHYIRDEKDLHFHLKYLEEQWIQHKLSENKWCYTRWI